MQSEARSAFFISSSICHTFSQVGLTPLKPRPIAFFQEMYRTTQPFDPEGVLGTINSVVMGFLGMQVRWISCPSLIQQVLQESLYSSRASIFLCCSYSILNFPLL